MSAPDPQLIAALLTAKAALDSALLALTKVDEPAAPAAEAAAEPTGDCTHPKDRRKTLAPTFGTTEHWICEACGYEYRR
jgi:hypothetical protein